MEKTPLFFFVVSFTAVAVGAFEFFDDFERYTVGGDPADSPDYANNKPYRSTLGIVKKGGKKVYETFI
jgi:hypothetical protein